VALTRNVLIQAKRDQLRKEGKLLTPKQKAEAAAIEQRRKAFLASGAKVEGLGLAGDSDKPKKVVYGNKKKPVKKAPTATEPPKAEVAPETPIEEAKPASPAPLITAQEEDDWDKEDEDKVDDLVKGVEGVAIDSGDDWDKSEDEGPQKPITVSAPKATVDKAPGKSPHRLFVSIHY
jgi:translation initiation factor 5B